MTKPKSARTVSVSQGIGQDTSFGAVTPPLYLSSTYTFEGFGQAREYEYSRTRNPSRDQLAATLASLEGGALAIVTASGMAALDLALSTLRADDLLLAPHDCYGGSYRLIQGRAERGHFKVLFVNQNDSLMLREGFGHRPRLVLVETPSNPLMRVVDIAAIASMAREAGAKLVVDNTFLSPALQNPLLLGADYVVHSTTKYINGHSDVVGGALVTADQADGEELSAWANLTGVTSSPFDAYLTLRGVRTLFPRMEAQQRAAMAIAEFLAPHPAVEHVYYPGLPADPGHTLAASQQKGFGAMLSFETSLGGSALQKFISTLRLFTLAESLGGVESLIAHPATMTHLGMGEAARATAGISDALLRLSVGLEEPADLIDDLSEALDAGRAAP
ncbi:O-succinylhomoserine (thiol)-lyase [Rhizobium sp. Root149]|uniref:cystathionine gamma-synthase n=1 Tax=Rhizobium sp. Root149 TaxID=1736473 RepID=UPI000714A4F4|nr:cystathionine gamma-synthase [Rhizobium sp. Root149]KQZ46622.1 O-succinylhomoserine (thiol)-lyase [Rhizobium sp. Root149]